MKRILWAGLAILVFSVILCGVGAAMPATAASGVIVEATPAEQPSDLLEISAMPLWGRLLFVPLLGLLVALCATPLMIEGSPEL